MTWSSWTSGSVSTTATTNRNQRTEPRIATFPGPCHATHRIPMSNLYQFMNICHKQSEEVSSNPLQNRFYSSLLSSCFPPLPLVVGWSLSSCFCILKYSQVLDLVRQFPSQKSLLRSKCHRIQNDFSDFSITYMYVYTYIYMVYIYYIRLYTLYWYQSMLSNLVSLPGATTFSDLHFPCLAFFDRHNALQHSTSSAATGTTTTGHNEVSELKRLQTWSKGCHVGQR